MCPTKSVKALKGNQSTRVNQGKPPHCSLIHCLLEEKIFDTFATIYFMYDVSLFLLLNNVLYCMFIYVRLLHGSETWPLRKENEVALQRAEICGGHSTAICDVILPDSSLRAYKFMLLGLTRSYGSCCECFATDAFR